ncbi:hypothetical protein SLE2022_091060 [Rubroshorea leprosula]
MDSREVHHPPGPPPGPSLLVRPPQPMMMGLASSYPTNSVMIAPNPTHGIPSSAARFPFHSLIPQPIQQPKPLDSLSSSSFDGSPQMGYNTDPTAKKKRGRPRKYPADGNTALQLATTSPIPSSSANHVDSVGLGGSGGAATPASSEPPAKKNRGRPSGSGKRQLDALGGTGGVGFTPHVITVQAGEDIAEKIRAFSQQGPRSFFILSANGAICNVTLRQPTSSGGSVTYEGQFEIISLSGSFHVSDINGNRRGVGSLSVSLAGSDGRVLGGGVAGMLTAASAVQVIVGSFIADGKKQSSNSIVPVSAASSLPSAHMLNFATPRTSGSTPSQGASSESSHENGDGGSPIRRVQPLYGSAAPSIHNNGMQMYHPLWTRHTQQ